MTYWSLSVSKSPRRFSDIALMAYLLLVAGCHGWMFPWVRLPVELGLGTALVLTSRPRSRPKGRLDLLRLMPALLGILGRHHYGIDMIGVLGVVCSLSLSRVASRVIHVVLACAFVRIALTTSAGWYVEEAWVTVHNLLASVVMQKKVELGPVFGGGRALAIAAVAMIAMRYRPWLWGRVAVLGAVAVLSSVAVALIAEALPEFGSAEPDTTVALLASQLAWVPAVLIGMSWIALATRRFSASKHPWPTIAAASGALVCVVASLPAVPGPAPSSIAFYRHGFQNWLVPDPQFSSPGKYSAGMLGTLPDSARCLGLEARIVDSVGSAEVADVDTLVFVNLNVPLPPNEQVWLEGWVRRGGRLVVIGDHTALYDHEHFDRPQLFLNHLLAFSRIRFRNTSGDHLTHGFRVGVEHPQLNAPLVAEARNPSGGVIGASLELQWPASPLIVGRWGYEDLGLDAPEEGRGHLGDLCWEPGERLGGITLAATERIGSGQVTVIADTTGVTNIGRAFYWRWWARLLTADLEEAPGRFAATGLALLVAIVLLLLYPRHPTISSAPLLIVVGVGIATAPTDPIPSGDSKPLGIIDLATRPRGRLGSWDDDGMLSVMVNLCRADHVAIFADSRDRDLLERASCIVISAPQIDPGSDWAASIINWTKKGGRLIIGVSHPDSRGVDSLLNRLQLRSLPKVLGPIELRIEDKLGKWSPLFLPSPWSVRAESPAWTPVAFSGADTLVCERKYGRGVVVVIADSTFLSNRALEGEWGYRMENLKFLRRLLTGRH